MNWSASPQISELKAVLPASKMPTILQFVHAETEVSPEHPSEPLGNASPRDHLAGAGPRHAPLDEPDLGPQSQ